MREKESANIHIPTGIDVRRPGGTGEASVPLSSLNYLRLLAQKSIEKRSPDYIAWPIIMYAFSRLDKLPAAAERLFMRVMPGKVRTFLETYQQIPDSRKRCSILLRSWMAFRMIDDPIDGDSPVKLSAEDRVRFLEQRLENFRNETWDNRNAADLLSASALADAEDLSIKPMLKEGLLQVLESMHFDAERVAEFLRTGKSIFVERDKLEEYYFKLDTEGTGLGMLAVLDEKTPDQHTRLLSAMISRAVRIFYDLRDLKKEVLQGLVNIPAEDAERFGITMDDLVNFAKSKRSLENSPEPLRAWVRSQVREARQLLDSSRELWSESAKYKPPTQAILQSQYYESASQYIDDLGRKLEVVESDAPSSEKRIAEPWRSAEAVFEAQRLCNKYAEKLGITDKELRRFYSKSRNLALMYVGFSQKNTKAEVEGAGKAAFLSCAYDVCSDWRDNPQDFAQIFSDIVAEETPNLKHMAVGLFQRDIDGVLEQDGLERGVVALEFIVRCMGVRDEVARLDVGGIENLGLLLQIVDDVLDVEEDKERSDTNCLFTDNRDKYLQKLVTEFSDKNVDRMFPSTSLLRVVLKKAVKKASGLIRQTDK